METRSLQHVKNWIFDLDDTLYPSSDVIFNQVVQRIENYLVDLLKVTPEEAWTIQKGFYVRYGATVRGLIIEHQGNPKEFVDYIHDIDLSSLCENPVLTTCLKKLPGKRFVFTNGAREHAERVLKMLGIRDLFTDIFSIIEADYLPKPAPETYHKMMQTFGVTPDTSAMFDDSQKNLLTAHQLGLTTVWISANKRDNIYNSLTDKPDFCDYQTPSLCEFLKETALAESA